MFIRPQIVRPQHLTPRLVRPPSALAALGELGDAMSGTQATAELIALLKSAIIDHQGPVVAPTSLQAALLAAKNTYQQGMAKTLPTANQKVWNAWVAAAQSTDSDQNIYFMFAMLTAKWADKLIAIANANPALISDPEATKVSYTLVDTTQSGTTWYGGTTTTSKLTNLQWSQVLISAYDNLAVGITKGVLPFSYLTVLGKAVLAQPTTRKFPSFAPPTGNNQSPEAIAWRAAMKQLGWSNTVQMWYGFTLQAWAAENAKADQLDAAYASTITALNYLSGAAILDQIHEKVDQMAKERATTLENMRTVDVVLAGPMSAYVSPEQLKAYEEVKKSYAEAEGKSLNVLGPAGLWPAASLNGLGAATLIVTGTIGISVLGLSVWLLSLWTSVARAAAAQAKAITDSVLASVSEVQKSCLRTYEASAKTKEDEDAYQACLAQTKNMVDSIPKIPTSGGLGILALLGVAGAAGYFLYKKRR